MSTIIENTLKLIYGFIASNYSSLEIEIIKKEIDAIVSIDTDEYIFPDKLQTYESVQNTLSKMNEKENGRKDKGVFYTPSDVVRFILINSVKLSSNRLKQDNIHVMDLNGIPYKSFCFEKDIYDPTCGLGEFLLAALELKLDLLDLHHAEITKGEISKVMHTIHGNDINEESTILAKIRLFLCVLNRYGADNVGGLGEILNYSFMSYDYISGDVRDDKYDIIIGNPPYIEDSKSDLMLNRKYGNIYANVLDNSSQQLKDNGVLAFIIPLSYVATPRMKKIRERLYSVMPEQYIMSYSDRPDCLFTSVHQKLCILFAKKKTAEKCTFTAHYRYWYKEERDDLFSTAQLIKNQFVLDEYIPKLGNQFDISVYKKILKNKDSLMDILNGSGKTVYLNMRAAFWIKAFLNQHNGSEYKQFKCKSDGYAFFAMCLLNSSLFWWYWICVSDCWHITRKELTGFGIPLLKDFNECKRLAVQLENKLENTKVYVGTKQTDYEYKHKECVDVIHEIDDYIHQIYGLTKEEAIYIKNFAYRYRISGGVKNESN